MRIYVLRPKPPFVTARTADRPSVPRLPVNKYIYFLIRFAQTKITSFIFGILGTPVSPDPPVNPCVGPDPTSASPMSQPKIRNTRGTSSKVILATLGAIYNS